MADPETREVLTCTRKIIHVAIDKYEKDSYNKNISDWLIRTLGILLWKSIQIILII